MTSIKIKFRASTVADTEGCLYYQVIHNRIVRQMDTDYKIFASEWNQRSGSIVCHVQGERGSIIQSIRQHIRKDKALLVKVIDSLGEQSKDYTADDVVSLFQVRKSEQSLSFFMQEHITWLERLGKIRTAETYASTLRSFMTFREGCDILMEDIDSELMMMYEIWLKGRDVTMNTVSFYMRILHAAYNRAVERGIMEQCYPFKHVYTGVEKTVKRAIPIGHIKTIKKLCLPLGSSLDWSRDLFLFSFYTRGMSFVDMAFLKKRDLKDGVLTYRRRKTGQQLFIKWEKCMQEIVDKYPDSGMPYLLPIITHSTIDERIQYKNAIHLVNHRLKEVSALAHLPVHLTMYVARHTWASAARSKNIPLSVISEGMGHDSESTTQIYLASLDTSIIDKANELILQNL